MRLKTKLVLAATGVTLLVVLVLSGLFLAELLRQRIDQAVAANDILANEVRSATRSALEAGLPNHPPVDGSEAAISVAVESVLRENGALQALMSSIVRYSATVQDVSITDVRGLTLVSTDPDTLGQEAVFRADLKQVNKAGFAYQWQRVFGSPRVFDIAAPLDRNNLPFLTVHVGVRSTFLKASFAPGLRDALIFAILAAIALVVAAASLTNMALRPLEVINTQLEALTADTDDDSGTPYTAAGERPDTVVQVTRTLGRLQQKMRSNEAGYTALQTNMEQMLDTLRDGVLLFAADRSEEEGAVSVPAGGWGANLRAVMVSDAVQHFLRPGESATGETSAHMIGRRPEEIFAPHTSLGAAVLSAFQRGGTVSAEIVLLEDGRQVELSLDRIADVQRTEESIGTLLTLRDKESALLLEHELEVSRRLAAIGRITAGVGHEVKNPINAMVLHLELLRGKLAAEPDGGNGARRHVEILASEMQRLDRVVQTLANFSRPMELRLKVVDLRHIVSSVIDLTWEQMRENAVTVEAVATREALLVYVDADLLQQALLNLVLNGMQAMTEGGVVRILLRREQNLAVIEVKDGGTGIPAELLPRIFDLYFTTKKSGNGIGLATTYRILQMHGGALDVRSNTEMSSPDRGSTFAMRLPVSMASSVLRTDGVTSLDVSGASRRGPK